MNCCDCQEVVTETERRTLLECEGCELPMHAECAMTSDRGAVLCEECFYAEAQAFRARMKAAGMEV